MTKLEVTKAKKMLEKLSIRMDSYIFGKGQAITAYFRDGSQKIYHSYIALIEDITIWTLSGKTGQ